MASDPSDIARLLGEVERAAPGTAPAYRAMPMLDDGFETIGAPPYIKVPRTPASSVELEAAWEGVSAPCECSRGVECPGGAACELRPPEPEPPPPTRAIPEVGGITVKPRDPDDLGPRRWRIGRG